MKQMDLVTTENNMKMLKYLVETNNIHDGMQLKFKFANGYGASVVKHKGSYGSSEGCWEIAVLDKEGEIDYTTDLANDVIGWIKPEEIERWLIFISNVHHGPGGDWQADWLGMGDEDERDGRNIDNNGKIERNHEIN